MLYFLPSVINNTPLLFLNSKVAKDMESHAHLGLTFQGNMLLRNHLIEIYKNASKQFNMQKFVKYKVDRSMLTNLCLIKLLMEYGDVIWKNCHDCDSLWIAFNMKPQGLCFFLQNSNFFCNQC